MLKHFTVFNEIIMYAPQAAHITEILDLETYPRWGFGPHIIVVQNMAV